MWIRPSANNISGPIEIEVKRPDVKVLKTTSADRDRREHGSASSAGRIGGATRKFTVTTIPQSDKILGLPEQSASSVTTSVIR